MNMTNHLKAENWNFKRHPMCNFTILEEKEFVTRYKEGETFADMAKEVNVSRNSLWKIVTKAYNVEPYQTRGYPKQYDIDLNTFSELTERSAYALGLIASDGYIAEATDLLHFYSCDKEQMDNFLDCLKCDKEPTAREREIYTSTCYRVYIGHHKIINGISAYIPYRSKDFKKIPDCIKDSPYFRDFIRGFFDGDGHAGKENKTIVFTGKKSLMEDIREKIKNVFRVNASGINKVTGEYVKENSDTCHLGYSKVKSCKKLYEIMYKDAEYFLSRKKDNLIKHFGDL